MFLGCYILISYLPILVSSINSTSIHCHLLVWLSLGGIPFMLIIATVFAKMLRVYLIFSDPLSYKKILFSDPFLFLYILLLISPGLVVLVIMTSYDPFRVHELESVQDNFIQVNNRCLSTYAIEWLSSLLAYIFILSSALTCLALKTSKIRYKHFRDAKATNAFAYLSCFIGSMTLIYWYFFYELGIGITTSLISDCILYIGHSSIAVLCQLLLFVPKVYPPLKRRLAQNQVRSKKK